MSTKQAVLQYNEENIKTQTDLDKFFVEAYRIAEEYFKKDQITIFNNYPTEVPHDQCCFLVRKYNNKMNQIFYNMNVAVQDKQPKHQTVYFKYNQGKVGQNGCQVRIIEPRNAEIFSKDHKIYKTKGFYLVHTYGAMSNINNQNLQQPLNQPQTNSFNSNNSFRQDSSFGYNSSAKLPQTHQYFVNNQKNNSNYQQQDIQDDLARSTLQTQLQQLNLLFQSMVNGFSNLVPSSKASNNNSQRNEPQDNQLSDQMKEFSQQFQQFKQKVENEWNKQNVALKDFSERVSRQESQIMKLREKNEGLLNDMSNLRKSYEDLNEKYENHQNIINTLNSKLLLKKRKNPILEAPSQPQQNNQQQQQPSNKPTNFIVLEDDNDEHEANNKTVQQQINKDSIITEINHEQEDYIKLMKASQFSVDEQELEDDVEPQLKKYQKRNDEDMMIHQIEESETNTQLNPENMESIVQNVYTDPELVQHFMKSQTELNQTILDIEKDYHMKLPLYSDIVNVIFHASTKYHKQLETIDFEAEIIYQSWIIKPIIELQNIKDHLESSVQLVGWIMPSEKSKYDFSNNLYEIVKNSCYIEYQLKQARTLAFFSRDILSKQLDVDLEYIEEMPQDQQIIVFCIYSNE